MPGYSMAMFPSAMSPPQLLPLTSKNVAAIERGGSAAAAAAANQQQAAARDGKKAKSWRHGSGADEGRHRRLHSKDASYSFSSLSMQDTSPELQMMAMQNSIMQSNVMLAAIMTNGKRPPRTASLPVHAQVLFPLDHTICSLVQASALSSASSPDVSLLSFRASSYCPAVTSIRRQCAERPRSARRACPGRATV
jgi:hypothetical protein